MGFQAVPQQQLQQAAPQPVQNNFQFSTNFGQQQPQQQFVNPQQFAPAPQRLFHNSSQLLFLSELFQDLHLSHKELFHNQLQLLKDLFLNNSNLLLFQKFQSQRLLLEKMVRMVDMSMILLEMPPSADLSCSSRGRLLKLQDKQHYNSFVIGLI